MMMANHLEETEGDKPKSPEIEEDFQNDKKYQFNSPRHSFIDQTKSSQK
jgi:hypothetical protein